MLLPSEHVYLGCDAVRLLLPAVKKVAARVAGARRGLYPHIFPFDRTDQQRSAAIYSGRQYDEALASQFQLLQNRLATLGAHGKLRLNLVHATLLAFAIRHNREEQRNVGVDTRELETSLENLRRRLKRATFTKLGAPHYQAFKRKWDSLIQWMSYYLFYDRKHFPRITERVRRDFHRDQLAEVAAWTRKMVAERCSERVPDEILLPMAAQIKRHARRRRFARQRSRKGKTLRTILRHKAQHEDEVFAYMQKRIPMTVKLNRLDPSLQRVIRQENGWTAIHKQAGSVSRCGSPITRADSSHISDNGVISVAILQGQPVLTESKHSREKLIRLVADFFVKHVEPSYWFDIREDAKRFAWRYVRKFHRCAGSMEPKEMPKWVRPEWEPTTGPEQHNWYMDCLFEWLGCYMHLSQVSDILSAAISLAHERTEHRFVDNWRAIAYHN